MAQMRAQDAFRILQAKLAAIEQEHQAELEGHDGFREPVDARAEARALTAILDFLQSCKIAPGESLLRVFRRYLRGSRDQVPLTKRGRVPRSRAS
jgi:hypothetical protein